MKAFCITVQDIWKHGDDIVLVADTKDIPGMIFTYSGKYDFDTLKANIPIGKEILVASNFWK